jgi:hypothetical protein
VRHAATRTQKQRAAITCAHARRARTRTHAESEYALWLEAIANGGSYGQLARCLARAAGDLNQLRPSTLDLVQRFFTCVSGRCKDVGHAHTGCLGVVRVRTRNAAWPPSTKHTSCWRAAVTRLHRSERAAAALSGAGPLAAAGASAWQQQWVVPDGGGHVREAGGCRSVAALLGCMRDFLCAVGVRRPPCRHTHAVPAANMLQTHVCVCVCPPHRCDAAAAGPQ